MEENNENAPVRRRRHSRPKKKKSIIDKASDFFITETIRAARESKEKKRKKRLKKILEFSLWGLVIVILFFSLVGIFSEVSIKDRRNTGKGKKKTGIIMPLRNLNIAYAPGPIV
jgi:hypothetical protein